MSLEAWSWILFGSFFLLAFSQYYAVNSRTSLSIMIPIAIFYIGKIVTLAAFGIVNKLPGFIAIAILEIFIIVFSFITIRKESNVSN
jgi:uncharacterized membrane protein YcaP (DUF421 family)